MKSEGGGKCQEVARVSEERSPRLPRVGSCFDFMRFDTGSANATAMPVSEITHKRIYQGRQTTTLQLYRQQTFLHTAKTPADPHTLSYFLTPFAPALFEFKTPRPLARGAPVPSAGDIHQTSRVGQFLTGALLWFSETSLYSFISKCLPGMFFSLPLPELKPHDSLFPFIHLFPHVHQTMCLSLNNAPCSKSPCKVLTRTVVCSLCSHVEHSVFKSTVHIP